MLLDDVGTYLNNAGIGLTLGTNLFKLPVPENVSSTTVSVSIIEYPGREADHTFGASLSAPAGGELPRFQINVMGPLSSLQSIRSKAEDIYKKLDYLANSIIDGTTSGATYLFIRALQAPFLLPPDSKTAQHRVVTNYEARKTRG